MMSFMENLMLFHYGTCKTELHDMIQAKRDTDKKIQDLERQIVALLGQIQEGKAMYDYQTAVLEKQVAGLQVELGARKCVCDLKDEEITNLQQLIARKDTEISAMNTKLLTYEAATIINKCYEEPKKGKKK